MAVIICPKCGAGWDDKNGRYCPRGHGPYLKVRK